MATDPLQGAHMYKSTHLYEFESTHDEFESTHDEFESATDTVRHLIEVNRDAQKGLSAAADAFDDEHLARRFRDLSQQSGRFVDELISSAPPADLEEESGSLTSTLRRVWIEINAATTSDGAILADAEAGEDRVINAYADALATGLPPATDPVARRQYEEVKARHDEIRALRDERR
jgi:uncharacterized protein (TIGR02284 family)